MAESRKWLEQAKGQADSANAAAAIAQTHALLALNDRVGALLERWMTAPSAPRVSRSEQEHMDDAAIARVVGEHPVTQADRAWLEDRKAAAVKAQNAPAIRATTDALNRSVQTSQYADYEDDLRAVEEVERRGDPDPAESAARARRLNAQEHRRMDAEARAGVGIFGQLGPEPSAPEEDG